MTQAFWDAQFRFTEIIPNFAAQVTRMADESQAYARDRVFHRQAYGASDRQWVEWTSADGPDHMLPVVIHGGYWRALEAENHRFLLPALTPFGGTVANVEYRLMPRVRLDDVAADVRTGLTLLTQNNPNARLLIVGHSAGAHLSVSALAEPCVADRVVGVLALSGVYDLTPLPLTFLQDEVSLTRAEVRDHSLFPAEDRPPVLYVNGAEETQEFMRGSALMASQGRSAWCVLPKGDHMSLLWEAMSEMPQLIGRVSSL